MASVSWLGLLVAFLTAAIDSFSPDFCCPSSLLTLPGDTFPWWKQHSFQLHLPHHTDSCIVHPCPALWTPISAVTPAIRQRESRGIFWWPPCTAPHHLRARHRQPHSFIGTAVLVLHCCCDVPSPGLLANSLGIGSGLSCNCPFSPHSLPLISWGNHAHLFLFFFSLPTATTVSLFCSVPGRTGFSVVCHDWGPWTLESTLDLRSTQSLVTLTFGLQWLVHDYGGLWKSEHKPAWLLGGT